MASKTGKYDAEISRKVLEADGDETAMADVRKWFLQQLAGDKGSKFAELSLIEQAFFEDIVKTYELALSRPPLQ